MAKRYSMSMGLETAAFEASCRRVEKSLSAVEKAGKSAAAAATLGAPGAGGGGGSGGTGAGSAAAKAAQARASELQRIEDRWMIRDYRARGEHERRKIALTEASAARQAQAFGKVSAAVTGLPVAVTGVGAALLGLEVGSRIVSGLAGAFDDAKQAASDMAKQTLATLGSLKEIAAIKEKFAPTDEELAQHLAVRKAGGLTHGVAIAYQTELYNALGTISKEKFSEAERSKLEIEGAKLIGRTVKPGDEATAKAKSTVLGLLPDYLPGKPTAGRVADVADAVDVILGKGAGSQQTSTTQFMHLLTATTSEKMPGQFRDPRMAAAFVATASKFGPESAGEASLEAFRQLRGFTKELKGRGKQSSQGQALKAMGLTEFDAPDVAMTKMFKYADEHFKGEAFDVALARRGFSDMTGNKRLAQFYAEYQKGTLGEMVDLAKTAVPEGAAAAKAAAYGKDKTARGEFAETDVEIAEIERGKRGVELEIAKRQAKATMTAEGLYDTPLGQIAQRAASVTSFGRPGAEVLLEQRALNEARMRAGIAPAAPPMEVGPSGDLGRFMYGLKALFDSRFADTAEQVNQLKRIADSNEEMARRDAARRAGGVPPPLGGGPAFRGGPVP